MAERPAILLVDDHFNFLNTALDLLTEIGFKCAGASSGAEALLEVRNRHYELIFLDIRMPLMNGVETFKQIHQISPDTPVVMMTAHWVEDLVQEALREGAVTVLKKPLNMNQIKELLETLKVG